VRNQRQRHTGLANARRDLREHAGDELRTVDAHDEVSREHRATDGAQALPQRTHARLREREFGRPVRRRHRGDGFRKARDTRRLRQHVGELRRAAQPGVTRKERQQVALAPVREAVPAASGEVDRHRVTSANPARRAQSHAELAPDDVARHGERLDPVEGPQVAQHLVLRCRLFHHRHPAPPSRGTRRLDDPE